MRGYAPWWVKSKQPSIQIRSFRIGIAVFGGCSGSVSAAIGATGMVVVVGRVTGVCVDGGGVWRGWWGWGGWVGKQWVGASSDGLNGEVCANSPGLAATTRRAKAGTRLGHRASQHAHRHLAPSDLWPYLAEAAGGSVCRRALTLGVPFFFAPPFPVGPCVDGWCGWCLLVGALQLLLLLAGRVELSCLFPLQQTNNCRLPACLPPPPSLRPLSLLPPPSLPHLACLPARPPQLRSPTHPQVCTLHCTCTLHSALCIPHSASAPN